MKRKQAKTTSSLSNARTYEAIGAYWDTHEIPSDPPAKPVAFTVNIRRRQYLVAIEPDIFAKVRRRAARQGVSAEHLLNLWAREKCAASR